MPDQRPLKIGITGSAGLLGRHLRAFLHGRPELQISPADRSAFASGETLSRFVANLDLVVHLAGMNRGPESEIETTNIRLAEQLIEACERGGRRPHVLFSSSAHITRETAYARSKRIAADRFRQWAARTGGRYTTLILPHVFGEGGKPFYNSVVSTFCHQLAAQEAPKVIQDGDLELLHAQRMAEAILEAVHSGRTGDIVLSGAPMKVTELLARLKELSSQYRSQIVPDLREPIQLDLFNTLRSYFYPAHYPVSLTVRSDQRGGLFEAIKTLNGGQSFLSSTRPGITRGNHYHRRKIERFLVVKGEALIRIRRLFSSEIIEFRVSGEVPQFIDIPTLHTHNITNTGPGELLTMFWAHEIFDPASPDTFAEAV